MVGFIRTYLNDSIPSFWCIDTTEPQRLTSGVDFHGLGFRVYSMFIWQGTCEFSICDKKKAPALWGEGSLVTSPGGSLGLLNLGRL